MERDASFGRWLQRRRKALDLTQDALAARVGCSVATIRKIETDARRPSRQIAEIFAEVLAIAPGERLAFLQAARAELAVDRLSPPSPPIGPAAEDARVRPLPTGTVTFLFTDIEGSSRLWERHPQAMPDALARHDAILRNAIEEHDGVVFRTVGDAVCAAFAHPPDALAAALAAQRALRDAPWPASGPLRVRIALHSGVVELRTGDYLGQPLNRIARLLSAGHGGQIVLSRATEQLVADHLPPNVALRDLGTHQLRDLGRPEQIFQAVAADLPSDFPPLALPDARRFFLPSPLTPLIGRAVELAEVGQLLRRAECRLLTIVGPGGMGKTRLAIAAAAEQGDAFGDGVCFVALAPLSAHEFIVPAIAAAIGFAFYGPIEPKIQLLNYVREKALLLVLDNVEQLLDGAGLFSELLQHAPAVKLLATSRERLQLQGEWVVDLQGLAVPPPPSRTAEMSTLAPGQGRAELETYGAITLFVKSAERARMGFALSEQNRLDVARVCRLVEGLPLGIELAAAWVSTLSCQEIAQQIERTIDFLAVSIRDLPERHRSIRAVFDHSWKLLTLEERQVLQRLSVFRGGFTREAAEQMAGASLGVLSALMAKSLVRRTKAGRYDMHELIRQYAGEQLRVAGEIDQAQDQHLAFFLTLSEEAEVQLHHAEQRAWHDQLDTELDNIRAALVWSQTGEERGEAGLRLATALHWYWSLCKIDEGRRWLERALQRMGTQGPPTARAKALGWIAHLALLQADFTATALHIQQSQELYGEIGDQGGLGYTLWVQGMACCWQGDFTVARARLESSAQCFRQVDDVWGLAEAGAWLGATLYYLGDDATAQALLEESERLFRELGDCGQFGLPLHALGWIAERQGDVAKARALYEQCLALVREQTDRPAIALVLASLGKLVFAQGDDAAARAIFQERLTLWQDIGNQDEIGRALYWLGMVDERQGDYPQAAAHFSVGLGFMQGGADRGDIARCLAGLASAVGAMGQLERAVQLFGVVAAIREASAATLDQHERSEYERSVAAARAQLDEATFAAAWSAGQAMPLEQAITEALGTRRF